MYEEKGEIFMTVTLLSVLAGISIFLFFTLLAILIYEKQPKSRYTDEKDWLFYQFDYKIYEVLFPSNISACDICEKLKFKIEDIEKYCKILHIEPDYKHMAVIRIVSCLMVAISVPFGMFISMPLGAIGIFIGLFMIFYPELDLKGKTNGRRNELESEIPRFLDLLQTALYLNMPVEQAIVITCNNLDGVISEELKESIAQSQISVSGWQKVLQDLALLYDVDIFTELILDMITSYDKGASISESVSRKAKDIRQSHLLHVKEKASKTTTTILLPVVAFKIVPMLAFLCVPMIIQIKKGL